MKSKKCELKCKKCELKSKKCELKSKKCELKSKKCEFNIKKVYCVKFAFIGLTHGILELGMRNGIWDLRLAVFGHIEMS